MFIEITLSNVVLRTSMVSLFTVCKSLEHLLTAQSSKVKAKTLNASPFVSLLFVR